jgi:RNA-directed DNA polymerase
MGREWGTGQEGVSEALHKGKPAATDRRPLPSLNHSFTLDIVMGFEQRADAERFLQEWKERLRKFGLELHPDKTRLIEFGRFAAEDRKRRGEGKPETFNFLGFTHICAKNRKTGGFSVDRKTIRKRLSAKLKAVREELRRRWHEPVAEVGKWLRSVVQGYFNYHAVPGNIDSLQSFRAQVVWHWSRTLQRRSQKSRMSWERFGPLVARWIPSAVILHPRPAMRFNARYLR